ncbi:MAG: hypothetical protein GY881_10460, partial [Gammaproteobacteria bacterium]|nr:hypothetical protein [Gammaproteobacteria bacterium]
MINRWFIKSLSRVMGFLMLVMVTCSHAGEAELATHEATLIKAKFDQKAQIIESWYESDR